MPIPIYKMLISFALTIIFISIVTSCGDNGKTDVVMKDGYIYDVSTKKLYTGVVKGVVMERKMEYGVVNGQKHGSYNIYFLTGKPEMRGHMKDNKYDGKWTYYFPNGQIESEGLFVNDTVQDKWVWFYPDGSLKELGIFKDGKREGHWVQYNEKGIVIDQAYFINGERRKAKQK